MAELNEYKCPCCGGAVNFDPSVQKIKCPYCDTEFEMQDFLAYDECLKNDTTDNMDWGKQAGGEWTASETDGLIEYVCKSCGGSIVADENTAATSCPYCGNPVVMTGKLSGVLRPDYIIPFKFDKKAATAAYYAHLEKKKLLPDVFKNENHIDEIKGIYVPFWLFDADADGHMRFRATRVRHWSDSNYHYTETRYYAVTRDATMSFERVPVDGSSKMPDDLMESIEPFNFSDAKDFQTAYFAGYFADKYDVDEHHSITRANQRIKASTEENIRNTVLGYTTVTTESSSVSLKNTKVKYVMYPVWLLSTTWNNKNFLFAMNGQTGKFVGDLPMDKGKYWKYFFIYFLIIGAIAFAIAYGISLL